jgi:hypothetical protein
LLVALCELLDSEIGEKVGRKVFSLLPARVDGEVRSYILYCWTRRGLT